MNKGTTKEIFDAIVKLRGHVMKKLQTRHISMISIGTLHMLWMEGEHTASDIAKRLGITLPSVSVLLKDLHKKGWIRRHKDPKDLRKVLVSLTPEGVTMVRGRVGEIIETLFGHLSGDDRKKYIEIINKIHKHLSDNR